MAIYINDIATAVPPTFEEQQSLREIMKEGVSDDRRTQAILHRVYTQSGIKKRHLIRNDYRNDDPDSFFKRAMRKYDSPTTEERNEIYQKEATKLFIEVADKLLAQNPDLDKHSITHVITVSCTGFFAPGPDFEIVRHLGLKTSTQRFHIGFMGCYAVFPALKLAKSICEADSEATVLVLSCELCTLHFQAKDTIDSLLADSVFGDGASGALVSTKKGKGKGYRMDTFASALAYEGEQDMAWTIGNNGFNMVLSSYVPDIISANLPEVIQPIFDEMGINKEDIHTWAVHPGGRAIVDKTEESMGLSECQVKPSRDALAEYGNMSSATILFVLDNVRNTEIPPEAKVLPIAFGPGLTIETGIFTVVDGSGD